MRFRHVLPWLGSIVLLAAILAALPQTRRWMLRLVQEVGAEQPENWEGR